MQCDHVGTVVEVKGVGRGVRRQQCSRCTAFLGLPYTLATKRYHQRMYRAAERRIAGTTPRTRPSVFQMAMPAGDRD